MRRINRILEQVPEIKDSARCKPIPWVRGKVEIKGLSFAYSGQSHYALKNIELRVDAGETVALVGRVGSGKTTLLNTIPRLLDVPRGTVFIDGRDLLQIPISTLRKNIGFATQDVFIFSDTIRNNVMFGRSDVSQGELEAILEAADILKDIQDLDHGLDTVLGERGITLSGGQRQRLAVARALVSNPPILILDDAISMVDTRTEQNILNRIQEFRQDKTNLIVSQRISTISRASRIAVLERGELVEQGPHQKLLSLRGTYATLYKRQTLIQEFELGAI